MPRAAVVLLSLALVAGSATAAMSSTPLPQGYKVVAAASMYTGVDYVKLKKPDGPVVAHVARILPNAPVDFRVVNADDQVSSSWRTLELTSSMCGRVRCVVGVNGDFHMLGVPVGGIVSDGRMLKSPDPGRAQLTVTTEGKLVAGPLPWTGTLTAADGAQIPVTAVNTDPPANGMALYTAAYGGGTPASGRAELIVKAPASIGAMNKMTELEVTGFRVGAGPIPAGGAVLSGDGAGAQQLADLWARQQGGTDVRLQVSSPLSVSASLGVEPVVLRDGARAPGWRDPNLINPRQPHTLIGWNKAGETYLVAVDGRTDDSDGVTMAQAADFLLGLGATDAVSLDGGGGTTFVAGKSVWNRPSDGPERGAVNAFVVMAKPGLPLPPAAPPKPVPPQEPSGSTGTPGSPGSPGSSGPPGSQPTSGGELPPGTAPANGSVTDGWPTTTDGSFSWPTPSDGYSLTPGAPTSGRGGKPVEPTVVVSPASAGAGTLPGVAQSRLVLIDPPSSGNAAPGESALASTSGKVTKRAGRTGSTTSTAGDSSAEGYAPGTASDRGGSLDWGRGLRVLAALGVGASAGGLFAVRRRRPIFSF